MGTISSSKASEFRLQGGYETGTHFPKSMDTKLMNNLNNNYNKNSFSSKPPETKDTAYLNKRKTYLNKLNTGEIKEPRPSTLEYYEIVKEGDTYEVKKG